jgi:Fe2+ transport system protein FeoA
MMGLHPYDPITIKMMGLHPYDPITIKMMGLHPYDPITIKMMGLHPYDPIILVIVYGGRRAEASYHENNSSPITLQRIR